MSSYEFGKLAEICQKSKKERSESSTNDSNDFNLIYKYWMEKAPFVKFESGAHKKALAKFIKKARKNNPNMPSLGDDSPADSSKKQMKKRKKSLGNDNGAENYSPFKIKKDISDAISELAKYSPNKISQNKLSSSIEEKTPNKKKKKKNKRVANEGQSFNEMTDSGASTKQSCKSEELDDESGSKLNVSTFNSSIDSHISNQGNLSSVKETPENQNSKKKQRKKKKKKPQSVNNSTLNQSSTDNEQMNDDSVMHNVRKERKEQNISKISNNDANLNIGNDMGEEQNIKKRKKKKKKNKVLLQTEDIERNNFVNKQEISGEEENKIFNETNENIQRGNKKNKKKRTLSEMSENEKSIGDECNEEKPKKKVRKEFPSTEIDIANEQDISKKKLKKLKKKKEKLKGIIPGLDSEPTLTKFSFKAEDETILDNEDENSEENFSFPRTSNDKVFVPKIDSKEKNDRTLYIGNIPTNVNQKTLMEIFKPFGNIESLRIRNAVPANSKMSPKIANMTHNYHENLKALTGYIVFSNVDEANSALELNGKVFNGHHLRVDKAFMLNCPKDNKSHFNNELCVFVGNLPYDVDDETLRNAFVECGKIKNVRVIRHRETGIGKGFGFVEFEEKSGIDAAFTVDGTEINGREIRVKKSEDKPKSPPKKFEPKWNKNEEWANKRMFKKNFKGKGGPDSGSRKTFKKMNKKRHSEQEKKKIAAIFKKEKP